MLLAIALVLANIAKNCILLLRAQRESRNCWQLKSRKLQPTSSVFITRIEMLSEIRLETFLWITNLFSDTTFTRLMTKHLMRQSFYKKTSMYGNWPGWPWCECISVRWEKAGKIVALVTKTSNTVWAAMLYKLLSILQKRSKSGFFLLYYHIMKCFECGWTYLRSYFEIILINGESKFGSVKQIITPHDGKYQTVNSWFLGQTTWRRTSHVYCRLSEYLPSTSHSYEKLLWKVVQEEEQ